jgi:hypothetical protein
LSAEAIEIKKENSELRAEIEALLYINEEFGKEMEELKAERRLVTGEPERRPVTGEPERMPVTRPIVVIEPYTIPQELAAEESQTKSSTEESTAESTAGSEESSEESEESTEHSTELSGEYTEKQRIQPSRKAKGKSAEDIEFDQEETRVI